LLFHGGSVATTTAAAIATAATTIAATVATAMAAAVATAVATAMAATATIAAAAATVATTTTMMAEGHRFVVSAQEGDSDDREENRETEHNDTIHSQILQKYLRYR
jgi:hypothetical protein